MDWKKVLRNVASILLILLILFSLIGMAILGTGVKNAGRTGTFNLFGKSYHLNKSRAMEPAIGQNELVVVEHTDFSSLKEGDFVAFFYTVSGEKYLLIRRLEKIDGLSYIMADTQGNTLEISAENCRILGRAVSRSASLGQMVLFLQSEDGRMIFYGWTFGAALFFIGLTILFHVLWKLVNRQNAPGIDRITGEALAFDDPVGIPAGKE